MSLTSRVIPTKKKSLKEEIMEEVTEKLMENMLDTLTRKHKMHSKNFKTPQIKKLGGHRNN
jgi:hypothetical protein